MLMLNSIVFQSQEAASLQKRVELFARCVLVVAEIIESGGALTEQTIALRLGYSREHSERVSFIWMKHPALRRIVHNYQYIMSTEKENEVRERTKITEIKVMNAAVRLCEEGEEVNTSSLAAVLHVSSGRIREYLRFQEELKEEIRYVSYATGY